jgi:uncharacterized protein (DUF924 family)
MHEEVLKFWFQEIDPTQWWGVDPAFDDLSRRRFGALLDRASKGDLAAWRATSKGRLAEIIVLDQFSRNIHRGTPRAFAQDPLALASAKEAVAAGAHKTLTQDECTFLLMPYMHSESAKIHFEAEGLYREFTPPLNYDFELRHKAIIDRFGRYPHRNEILGRMSTPEEIEFLKQPGSRF